MSLEALLELYGSVVRSSWGQVTVPCPFDDHTDSKPSFRANLDTGLWVCKGCDRRGNMASLVEQKKGEVSAEVRSRAIEILGGSIVGLPSADESGGSFLPGWARNQYGLGRDLSARPSRGTDARPRNDDWKNRYTVH